MTTNPNDMLAQAARGAGALAFRRGRPLHLAVTEAIRATPEYAGREPDIRSGWYDERRSTGYGWTRMAGK